MENKVLIVDGDSLSIEDVFNVSYNNIKVEFPKRKAFKENIIKSRKFFEAYLEKGYPIYGVTTGFGDSCDSQINPQKTDLLQRSLVKIPWNRIGSEFQ